MLIITPALRRAMNGLMPCSLIKLEKPRKERVLKPETLAAMAAKKTPRDVLLRRQYLAKQARRQANMAAGLTNDGKPRKLVIPKHRNAINALAAGVVPFLTYQGMVHKTGLFMAAKRLGVKVKLGDGKCWLDNGNNNRHNQE